MPKEIKSYRCSAGNRKKQLWKYEYSEKLGCPDRIPNGFMDLQDFIQASADDVDFKAIGKMLVDTRDNIAGHFEMEGKELDITRLPRNIHEFEHLHNKIKSEFESLPTSIKVLFNDDLSQFSSAWKSGRIGSIMDTYYKSLTKSSEEPGKVQEGDK